LEDLLGEVDAIQQAARGVIRAGLSGGDVYAPAEARLKASPHAKELRFVAHGMGLVSHEAPRLTATGPVLNVLPLAVNIRPQESLPELALRLANQLKKMRRHQR
ncbi:M24 family metallopeptidase, partial [Escherichia coli]|uniref:M24 family metallopeptidase n=1 Tax=Escherichia coli TaxID=562 RepID=UPI0019532B27